MNKANESIEKTQKIGPAAKPFNTGDVLLGRFEIVSCAGEGGFGVVYQAKDLQLGATVAIKAMHPSFSNNSDAVQSLKNEILLLRQLTHPNILKVYEYYEMDDRHFITMEWVDGASLEALIQEGQLEPLQIDDIIKQCLIALTYTASQGVCHKDLKPENIMVLPDGQIRLFDFGIAGTLNQAQTGFFAGSPVYCAPEYLSHQEVNASTDFYSLGVLIYRLCCVDAPFEATSLEALVSEKQQLPKFNPTHGSLNKYHGVVNQLLSPIPSARPVHQANLLAAIETEGGSGWWMKAWVFASMILLVAGLYWYKSSNQVVDANPSSLVVLPFHDTHSADQKIHWLAQSGQVILSQELSDNPVLRVVSPSELAAAMKAIGGESPYSDRQIASLGQLLNAEHFVQVTLRPMGPTASLIEVEQKDLVGLQVITKLQQFEVSHGQDVGATLEKIALEIAGGFEGTVSNRPSIHFSPEQLRLLANINQSSELSEKITHWQALLAAVPEYQMGWLKLGALAQSNNNDDLAQQAYTRVLSLTEPKDPIYQLSRARLHVLMGQAGEAEAFYQKLISEGSRDAVLLLEAANYFINMDLLAQAESALQAVVSVNDKHPRAWFELAKVAIWQGEINRAIEEYLTRALVTANHLKDTQAKGDVLNAFGVAYQRLGDNQQAIDYYQQALTIRQQMGNEAQVATTMSNLSAVLAITGRHQEAQDNLTQALQLYRKINDELNESIVLNEMGILLEEQGQYQQAKDHYQEALDIRMRLDEKWLKAESMNNLGFMYFLEGEHNHATIYWQQAMQIYQEVGDEVGEVQIMQNQGQLALRSGKINEATKLFNDSLALAQRLGLLTESLVAQANLAKSQWQQGSQIQAVADVSQVYQEMKAANDVRGMVEFGLLLAEWQLYLLDEVSVLKLLEDLKPYRGNMNPMQNTWFNVLLFHAMQSGDEAELFQSMTSQNFSDHDQAYLLLKMWVLSDWGDVSVREKVHLALQDVNLKPYPMLHMLYAEVSAYVWISQSNQAELASPTRILADGLVQFPNHWRRFFILLIIDGTAHASGAWTWQGLSEVEEALIHLQKPVAEDQRLKFLEKRVPPEDQP